MAARVALPAHLKPQRCSRIPFTPPPRPEFKWEGVFEGWARNWVRKHFWRVREHFCNDQEDALQECAWLFVACVDRYGSYVDEPKWMMALFKRIVWAHWHDLAKHATAHRNIPAQLGERLTDADMTFSLGPLQANLQSCSAEVKQFLRVMAEAPAEFLQLIFRDDGDLAKLNRRARRLLGIKNPAVDIVSELRQALAD